MARDLLSGVSHDESVLLARLVQAREGALEDEQAIQAQALAAAAVVGRANGQADVIKQLRGGRRGS